MIPTRFDLRNRDTTWFLGGAVIVGLMFLLVLVVPRSARAADAEQVFQEASQYTVKIRARIETAFIEDQVGVYEGAGFLVDAERGWIVTIQGSGGAPTFNILHRQHREVQIGVNKYLLGIDEWGVTKSHGDGGRRMPHHVSMSSCWDQHGNSG